MRGEDRPATIKPLLRVLDAHVVDAVGELERELGRVEVLVCEMGRVEVDAERRASADGCKRLLGCHEVVCDLRRVHLQAEADTLGVEDVEDR